MHLHQIEGQENGMGRVAPLKKSTAAEPMGPAEVREIRYRLGQSQGEFALMIGVSVATLQAWEEGRHHPDGAALALLRVASKHPKIVAKDLGHG